MSGALAVLGRILASLRGDPRTLALVIVAPLFIVFLFSQVFDAVPPGAFQVDVVKTTILGFFVFFLTYLLTAIGFLRERQSGTLERLFISRASRLGLVVGYLAGYGLLALLPSTSLLVAGLLFFDIEVANGLPLFFALEVAGALSALGLGILVSFFAKSEFQVLQFIPIVIAPQVILGGVFVPVESLPWYLEGPARVLPLTYLLEAMNFAILDQGAWSDVARAFGVLGAYVATSVALAALAIRRAR